MSDSLPNPDPPSASVEVTLDGNRVPLPPNRRSINAIRCYLETLAMEQQRILFTFKVDGEIPKRSSLARNRNPVTRIVGETVDLKDMPVHLLETALQQVVEARDLVSRAISLVLINERPLASELWWNLTRKLKEPLLTLSLVPDTSGRAEGKGATPLQLRRWQLQQLAVVIREVDEVCWAFDSTALSTALETRVLPWLESLQELIGLWHCTMVAGVQAGQPLAAATAAPPDAR